MARVRGTGSIRKRRQGGWAIRYYRDGVEHHESVALALGKPASVITEQEAARLLQRRLGEIAVGRFIPPHDRRATVGELLAAKYEQCAFRRIKSLRFIKSEHGRLQDAFGHLRATALDTEAITRWANAELARGVAPGTVDKLLAYLKAALRYGQTMGKLERVPHIPALEYDNVRRHMVTAEQFDALVAHADPAVADVLRFARLTGWRKSEILGLTWAMVDRARGVLVIPDSKNGEPQLLPLAGALGTLIERRWRERALGCPAVFHRGGRPLRRTRFDALWQAAREAAGLPHLWVHDLRRTAYAEMIDSGADVFTAMEVCHHRTQAMARRYCIRPAKAMASLMERRDAWVAGQNADSRAARG